MHRIKYNTKLFVLYRLNLQKGRSNEVDKKDEQDSWLHVSFMRLDSCFLRSSRIHSSIRYSLHYSKHQFNINKN